MVTEAIRLWGPRAAALALIVVQLPVLARTAGDPSQSDFANYFTPAFVLARGGEVGPLYDRDSFDRALVQTGIRGLGSFIPHLPANALWLLPFATLPPENAKAAWTVLLVLFIGVTIAATVRIAPGAGPWMAAILVLAPTLAIRNGLAFGQPYPILAALLICGTLALERGRAFLAGLLLGLGVSFKPYALGIGLLFLHRDRRRSLTGFIVGAIAPSLALWIMAGGQPFAEFFSKVLPWMVRGDIQDPFSPGWGSAMALSNRFLRFEPDLNPLPWFDAPSLARFVGASVSAALLVLGILLGRRALDSKKPLDAVGISIGCALCASPFVASYHLILLVVPVLAVASRLGGSALGLWMLGWAILGSSLVNTFRYASGVLAPLAYLRFFGLLGLVLVVCWPFVNRRTVSTAMALGVLAGALALPRGGREESWARIESAKGYSMMRPHFCGTILRWWSPSKDGHRLESRGEREECSADSAQSPSVGGTAPVAFRGAVTISRFAAGSWNLYLRTGPPNASETRLTFSDANEVDPVFTPDGCAVVFASDQGRGLGSTALYRLDVSNLRDGCAGSPPAEGPR